MVTHDEAVASEGIEVMSGDVAAQVAELKEAPGRDLWLCGGADLAAQLLGLIDEIQVKTDPVLPGEGIPLFRGAAALRDLRAASIESLPGGVALATYRSAPTQGL